MSVFFDPIQYQYTNDSYCHTKVFSCLGTSIEYFFYLPGYSTRQQYVRLDGILYKNLPSVPISDNNWYKAERIGKIILYVLIVPPLVMLVLKATERVFEWATRISKYELELPTKEPEPSAPSPSEVSDSGPLPAPVLSNDSVPTSEPSPSEVSVPGPLPAPVPSNDSVPTSEPSPSEDFNFMPDLSSSQGSLGPAGIYNSLLKGLPENPVRKPLLPSSSSQPEKKGKKKKKMKLSLTKKQRTFLVENKGKLLRQSFVSQYQNDLISRSQEGTCTPKDFQHNLEVTWDFLCGVNRYLSPDSSFAATFQSPSEKLDHTQFHEALSDWETAFAEHYTSDLNEGNFVVIILESYSGVKKDLKKKLKPLKDWFINRKSGITWKAMKSREAISKLKDLIAKSSAGEAATDLMVSLSLVFDGADLFPMLIAKKLNTYWESFPLPLSVVHSKEYQEFAAAYDIFFKYLFLLKDMNDENAVKINMEMLLLYPILSLHCLRKLQMLIDNQLQWMLKPKEKPEGYEVQKEVIKKDFTDSKNERTYILHTVDRKFPPSNSDKRFKEIQTKWKRLEASKNHEKLVQLWSKLDPLLSKLQNDIILHLQNRKVDHAESAHCLKDYEKLLREYGQDRMTKVIEDDIANLDNENLLGCHVLSDKVSHLLWARYEVELYQKAYLSWHALFKAQLAEIN